MRRLLVLLFALPLAAQIAPQAPVFIGTGLNDLTAGGLASGAAGNHIFQINISNTGTPDKFEWNEDGGSFSSAISITGGAQVLADGITITFAATTGHTLSTTTANFWTVSVVVAGTVSRMTTIQKGPGAIFRPVDDKLRDIVDVRDFGAKCDGVTDDTAAIQAAFDSLQAFARNPDGVTLRTGLVNFPATRTRNQGGQAVNNGSCLISSTINISPFVTVTASGGLAVIQAATNFAPYGSATGLSVTGASWSSSTDQVTFTVSSTATLAAGENVSVIGVSPATFDISGAITSIVSGTTFSMEMNSSPGAWVSGGLVTSYEVFMLNVINGNGATFGNADNNFRVRVQDLILDATNTGNEFTSGINANASYGSYFSDLTIAVHNRGFVVGGSGNNTADNITGDDLTFTPPLFANGPCSQGLVYGSPSIPGLNVNAFRSLKFTNFTVPNGSNGSSWCPSTPALNVAQGALGVHIEGPNFEQVNYPLRIQALTQDIIVTGMLAGPDVCTGSSPFRTADYPQAVTIDTNSFRTFDDKVSVSGTFLNYATGVNVFNTAFGTNETVYTGFASCSGSATDFTTLNTVVEGPAVHANGRLTQLNGTSGPSGYGGAASTGTTAGGSTWYTPGGNAGAQLFVVLPGSAEGAGNKSYEISSCSSTDGITCSTTPYRYLALSQAAGGAASGYNVLCDPDGTSGCYFGGKTYFAGNKTEALGARDICSSGSNATCGTLTLSAGAATVATTALASSTDYVELFAETCVSCGWTSVTNRTPGTGFQVGSLSGTDASTFFWRIVHMN